MMTGCSLYLCGSTNYVTTWPSNGKVSYPTGDIVWGCKGRRGDNRLDVWTPRTSNSVYLSTERPLMIGQATLVGLLTTDIELFSYENGVVKRFYGTYKQALTDFTLIRTSVLGRYVFVAFEAPKNPYASIGLDSPTDMGTGTPVWCGLFGILSSVTLTDLELSFEVTRLLE